MTKEEIKVLVDQFCDKLETTKPSIFALDNSVPTQQLAGVLSNQLQSKLIDRPNLRHYNRTKGGHGKRPFILLCSPYTLGSSCSHNRSIPKKISFNRHQRLKIFNSHYNNLVSDFVLFLGAIDQNMVKQYAQNHPEQQCWFLGKMIKGVYIVPYQQQVEEGREKMGFESYAIDNNEKARSPSIHFVDHTGKIYGTGICELDLPPYEQAQETIQEETVPEETIQEEIDSEQDFEFQNIDEKPWSIAEAQDFLQPLLAPIPPSAYGLLPNVDDSEPPRHHNHNWWTEGIPCLDETTDPSPRIPKRPLSPK